MHTDGTGFHTNKECHKTESLWYQNTTDHKEGEQLEDRRSIGATCCNSGDGTDQRVQSLMFMMTMMTILLSLPKLPFHVPAYSSASVILISHSFLSHMPFIESIMLKLFDENYGRKGFSLCQDIKVCVHLIYLFTLYIKSSYFAYGT